jgi:hypothetical protein
MVGIEAQKVEKSKIDIDFECSQSTIFQMVSIFI